MKFSNRINSMQESPIRKLVPLAEQAKKNGKKVYHLNIGQPDIKTPVEFMDAIKEYDEEVLSYASSQGLPELINSFIKYFETYDIHFEKDEILVTNGGSEAILFSLLAVTDNGDEVLIPEPFYTNYNGFGSSAGVKVVPITTKAEEGFKLPNKKIIQKLVTNKTKAIVLSNPGNPTGAVYTKEEMNILRDIAKENDLFIISDEVYREFIYDGFEYMSFGEFKDIEDRVILTDSISKRYSACGARIGLIASKNKALIKEVLKLCQSRLCVPTIEQIGAAALSNVSKNYFDEVVKEYKNRRDIVYNALQDMCGVIAKQPHGAFYIIAKLPVKDAEDFVKWLLEDFDVNSETVMLAPAEGFYATKGLGKDEVRISYVLNQKSLKKAMDILKHALETYKK
ncbi:pyridoxal phosphate-dependent aminotransferase [Clostridium sp. D2Q-14]|uniref:pyridoxal phosphate-dependent aminotransferase n=1 Tax=Anaeromonas gelatinilytica TaxID=2683194 RepID=UPI00193C70A5|nr:pyridoxal phosphate-dependent aminotransferase [Anaeromonas gelatinilytica]MBS4536266.1 pyridoxal phosphate-dependent aminotransferase [Anaeromonas gelatinilytica]